MSLQFLSYHCVVPGGHLTGLQLIRLKSSPLGCRKARCLHINKVKSCLRAFGGGWGRVMPYPVPYAFMPQPLVAFTICVGLCVGILASQLPRVFFYSGSKVTSCFLMTSGSSSRRIATVLISNTSSSFVRSSILC